MSDMRVAAGEGDSRKLLRAYLYGLRRSFKGHFRAQKLVAGGDAVIVNIDSRPGKPVEIESAHTSGVFVARLGKMVDKGFEFPRSQRGIAIGIGSKKAIAMACAGNGRGGYRNIQRYKQDC